MSIWKVISKHHDPDDRMQAEKQACGDTSLWREHKSVEGTQACGGDHMDPIGLPDPVSHTAAPIHRRVCRGERMCDVYILAMARPSLLKTRLEAENIPDEYIAIADLTSKEYMVEMLEYLGNDVAFGSRDESKHRRALRIFNHLSHACGLTGEGLLQYFSKLKNSVKQPMTKRAEVRIGTERATRMM